MHPKDRLVIYHTGDERAAVGTATVVSVDARDPKVPLVRIRFGKTLSPKTLDAVKEEPLFQDSALVRQGRLSVVPLTDEQYIWITKA
jgi:predicted RNA-binding protein with PUA-like domain